MIHVSVRVVPVRGALSHGDLLKFFIIIIIIIIIIGKDPMSICCERVGHTAVSIMFTQKYCMCY